MNVVGVRSNFVAAAQAAPLMIRQGTALNVNISFCIARRYYGNVLYGDAKADVDAMSHDMGNELKPHGVGVVSLYPGHLIDRKPKPNPKRETAQFVGRVITAMALDPAVHVRSGEVFETARLAKEYRVLHTDGTLPIPYDHL